MTAKAAASAISNAPGPAGARPPWRALRGLVLGFLMSVVNLAGALLVVLMLGGLGSWTDRQFIGLFGLLEIVTGVAFIIGPNIWRLPVAEANTNDRTSIRLAASTALIPHWAAAAKVVPGLPMVTVALLHAGIGPATALLPLLVLLILAGVMGLSLVAARLGVARPDLDVVQLVVQRPGRPALALPGISISGVVVQLLVNIGASPAVKLFPPSVLYRPEMGPSQGLLSITGLLGAALLLAGFLAWRGRISWRAPREQQREAEAEA
jgi:hypothetical protein